MPTVQPVADYLEQLFEGRESTIARDLKLSLRKVLLASSLAPEDAAPALVALAASTGQRALGEYAKAWLSSLGATDGEVREAEEAAAMMAMLNTYYSFRQKLADDALGPAGLRMTALARPALGKARWEQVAFAVSVLNGCQSCIGFHAETLRALGASTEQIHDLARLASVVLALSRLFS